MWGFVSPLVSFLVLTEEWEVIKDGQCSASHLRRVPAERGGQLVTLPCNGRPFPRAGKLYWGGQGS